MTTQNALPLTSGFTQAGVQSRMTQSGKHHLLLSSEPRRCPRLLPSRRALAATRTAQQHLTGWQYKSSFIIKMRK